jgi:hypothetical protein
LSVIIMAHEAGLRFPWNGDSFARSASHKMGKHLYGGAFGNSARIFAFAVRSWMGIAGKGKEGRAVSRLAQ